MEHTHGNVHITEESYTEMFQYHLVLKTGVNNWLDEI
jgi:hypothetical protein